MAATNRAIDNAVSTPPPPPARTVKPRKRKSKCLPVVALGRDYFLAETGETGTIAELIDALPDYAPTLFCAVGAADFVTMLNQIYLLRTPTNWQWRAVSHERDICAPGKTFRATRLSTAIHYFGWQEPRVYHRIIDPVTVYGQSLDDIWPGEDEVKLLRWGVTLRDFCDEQGITVRPTLGGMASQFLTDSRFYPEARRKVPAKINERARENLPGNHYFLNVMPDPSNDFSAHYLDQHRAHHYHARTSPLPDANHCYAFGRFIDLSATAFNHIDPDFCGLYCLDLTAPAVCPPFDWIGDKLDAQFVYSNEVQHILDMGYGIRSVRAAWGSCKRDTGIPKYATWAERQLDDHSDAAWLKPLLLAVYGTLATRPVKSESIFRLAKKGVPVELRTGRHKLAGLRIQAPRKLEPKIAHVLQRGMIEAACRSESIGLAQHLDHLGHTILSIYADAVMVEADDDKPLPFIIEPWRLKRDLNHLQFINKQAFKSDGMTKLPGVGRDIMKYRQHSNRAPSLTTRKVRSLA